MKKKLQEYALLAEVISALAVICTLIILIIGIRENTEITKLTAYQSQIGLFNDFREQIASDDSKLTLFFNYTLGEIPEENTMERMKLNMLLNSLWGNYESAYNSYSSGIIEGDEWERVQRSVCFEYDKLAPTNMKDFIFFRLTSDFVNFIESTCLD